jgi:ferredoxin-NADP reductase
MQKLALDILSLPNQRVGDDADGTIVSTLSVDSLESTSHKITSIDSVDLSIWPAATLKWEADNFWKRGRNQVQCVAVIPETKDVKTFVFQAVKPTLFCYKPGQFATLELQIEGKLVRRSYTLSSSPSRPYTLSVTVKRVTGGLVSNWLHDNMDVGFAFNLSGPHGDFSCFEAPGTKLLMIAGGSGITPIMSMLRWIVDTKSTADIVMINNVRTPDDIVYEQELRQLAMQLGNRLKLGIVPSNVESGQFWGGPLGRFSKEHLQLWAPDFAEREVFVCGPSIYMETVKDTLISMGLPQHRYHQESFGSSPSATSKTTSTVSAASTVSALTTLSSDLHSSSPQVQSPSQKSEMIEVASSLALVAHETMIELVFSASKKTVLVRKGDVILEIAEEHGIEIANSCRSGACGTCRVKKTEGSVDMEGQKALSDTDLSDGFVLCCIGQVGDKRVVLDL